jgi:hypothetical protein
MNNIVKELNELNDSIYNLRIDIANKSEYKNAILINHPINIFNKYEQRILKFCKYYNNKKYTTYHNNNLTLYIDNNTNYVYETNIDYVNFISNNSLIKYTNNILDNLVFPNLEKYQNIINHNDNIYKFIIKYINIPIYIHFDSTDTSNIIYLESELNIQQLSYGIDAINYICKQFNS